MSTFTIRNLSVLQYAQGFTLWHYRALSETLASVLSPGYFQDAESMLEPGDMVAVSADGAGAIRFVLSVKPVLTLIPLS